MLPLSSIPGALEIPVCHLWPSFAWATALSTKASCVDGVDTGVSHWLPFSGTDDMQWAAGWSKAGRKCVLHGCQCLVTGSWTASRGILVSCSQGPSSPARLGWVRVGSREAAAVVFRAITSKVRNVTPSTKMGTVSWNQGGDYIALLLGLSSLHFPPLSTEKWLGAFFPDTSEM